MAKIVTYEPSVLADSILEKARKVQGRVAYIEVTSLEYSQLGAEGAIGYEDDWPVLRGRFEDESYPLRIVDNDPESRSRRRVKGDGRKPVT